MKNIVETSNEPDGTICPEPGVWSEARKNHLCSLAASGLERMFSVEEQLFCQRSKYRQVGLALEGLSVRYTMMALLGLFEYQRHGGSTSIPVSEALQAVFQRTRAFDNIGDVGLLIWLCAREKPDSLAEVDRVFKVGSALERYLGARKGNTMELAWFLTGLSYAKLNSAHVPAGWEELALRAREMVEGNRGESFFGHCAPAGSIAGRVRGSVGSFADQVYSIYGLTQFSVAFGVESALQSALTCATSLCRSQGQLGQWWWHYDATNSTVVQRYPVYSVHQHSMGPMALFAVSRQSERDFSDCIYRGLNWISGSNELSTSMLDEARGTIWRAVQPRSRLELSMQRGLAGLRIPKASPPPRRLRILFECWPYELGWLLYALARAQPNSGAS